MNEMSPRVATKWLLAQMPSGLLHKRAKEAGFRVIRDGKDGQWFETDEWGDGILCGRGYPTRAALCRALLMRHWEETSP